MESGTQSQALGRTSLRAGAEAFLRDLVIRGQLKPGDRVNEVAVASQLGISRGPLREAIQALAREGLLEIISHRGAFVRTIDAGELRDLYEVRVALDVYAVQLLAKLPRSAGVNSLVDLVEQAERQVGTGDGYPNDADFHGGIFAALGNAALAGAADDVQRQISLARATSARDPERAAAAVAEHRAIIEAVKEGRVDEAARLAEDHLWCAYRHAVSSLAR